MFPDDNKDADRDGFLNAKIKPVLLCHRLPAQSWLPAMLHYLACHLDGHCYKNAHFFHK